jgi:hypothetical protein
VKGGGEWLEAGGLLFFFSLLPVLLLGSLFFRSLFVERFFPKMRVVGELLLKALGIISMIWNCFVFQIYFS